MDRIVEKVAFDRLSPFRRKNVAAYARVSAEKDSMLHSLSAQISYYSQMIQCNPEWEYCGVYADEGISGTKEEREGFQRMLEDCRSGLIDIVITKSVSRFARNTVTLLKTVRELRCLGVDVYFEEQRIHTLSSDGELLLTLLSSFAQAESYSVSENMKWSYRRRFAEGKTTGVTVLFGYDVHKNRLTVNNEEAAIVREIFSRFVGGESMTCIARSLNARNVSRPLGGRFIHQRIGEILSSEKYLGDALLQKTFMKNHLDRRRSRNRGELPQYLIEGDHEAIIDRETFERAQQRRRSVFESQLSRKPACKTVFSGMIRCAKCGALFRSHYNQKKIWQCVTYREKGREACASKSIPDEILRRVCCALMGTESFDEDAFRKRVAFIEADNDPEGSFLVFHMTDGTEKLMRWNYPSRRESWTPEMKAKAAEQARKRAAERYGVR